MAPAASERAQGSSMEEDTRDSLRESSVHAGASAPDFKTPSYHTDAYLRWSPFGLKKLKDPTSHTLLLDGTRVGMDCRNFTPIQNGYTASRAYT